MKPFYKTSEFWKSLISAVLPWVVHSVPGPWAAAITAVSTAAYSISRGIAKGGQPTP